MYGIRTLGGAKGCCGPHRQNPRFPSVGCVCGYINYLKRKVYCTAKYELLEPLTAGLAVWGGSFERVKDLGRCTGKQSNRRESRLNQNVWRITVDRIPVVMRWGDGGDEENGQEAENGSLVVTGA